MTPHRIVGLNALTTAVCALGMLATRGTLHTLFGLDAPGLLDAIAVGLLAYAGALGLAARGTISRQTLMAFTAADALWVVGSGVALVLFWDQLAVLGRVLIIAAAIVVDVFATLQFMAAGKVGRGSPQVA